MIRALIKGGPDIAKEMAFANGVLVLGDISHNPNAGQFGETWITTINWYEDQVAEWFISDCHQGPPFGIGSCLFYQKTES